MADMEPPRCFSEIMEERRRNSAKPGTVYFIGSSDGFIKIGITSDIVERLRNFQVCTPHELTVLASFDGDSYQEWEYHQRFADHRVRGEWFRSHPDILAEIERLLTILATQGPTP